MNRIKNVASLFPNITTGILIAAAIFINCVGRIEKITSNILWQILLCAFLSTMGSLIYPTKELPKRQTVILSVINYIYVNMIVIGCGIVFDWFDLADWGKIILLIFLVAVVFVVVWGVSTLKQQRLADEMNKRLAEYQRKNQ